MRIESGIAMRSQAVTFVVMVAAIFVGLFLYDEFRAKRPVDDFGVGKAHERVKLIQGDYARAADPARTAVAEFYINSGKWPATNKDVGLPEPSAYRGDSLRSLEVSENRITLTFDDKIGPDGGKIILIGTYLADQMGIKWACVSPNIADISVAVGTCRNAE
jgi:hypothetical protein